MSGNDYFIGTTERVAVRKFSIVKALIGIGLIALPFIIMKLLSLYSGSLSALSIASSIAPSSPVFIIVGVVLIIFSKPKYENKTTCITDRQYDSFVESEIDKLASNPKEYLGLDDSEVMEIEPIEFGGYKFLGADKYKKGKDGLYRSNLYEKATIYFTANEVHMYKAFFNSISGVVNETTEVLFYSDIVSVSTDNETEKIGDVSINYLRFVLTSTGGKQFSVALLGNDNRQRSINAMRALIKEKKLV